MRIAWTKPIFAWDCLDDDPDLKTIEAFLHLLPDGRLLEALARARGRGRDDYPVGVLWGVVLLTPLLRHTAFAQTLAELRRNPSLRRLLGIESADDVPHDWNVTRFLKVLGTEPFLTLAREVFDTLVRRLAEAVPDLGRRLAGDATALSAREGRAKKEDDNPDGLPEPAGGRKEYTDDEGKVVKVVTWFGYKLHLLVDVLHEVVVAYRVSSAKDGDNELLPALVDEAAANLPVPAEGQAAPRPPKPAGEPARSRIETLAYDKAADDGEVHGDLAEHGIKPVIQNRALWKTEPERMLPGHNGSSNLVYDEAGTVYCYDKVSDPPVRQKMAYIGHEPARGTIKYRCPAMHGGLHCPSHGRCNAGKEYGKTVRVKCELDLRRFPPIPRATKQFERLYKGRTAVERVNARIKIFWGADDGNVTGAPRFHAHVATLMLVHIGLATLLAMAPRHAGVLGQTRLTAVAQALREKLALASG
ncbi:MAG: transposase [Candidatus Deferrimicrobiota bacterium]